MKKLGIFLIVLPLILSSCFVLTGSYIYCEGYDVKMDNESIIQKFKQIKEEHPEYQAYGTTQEGEVYNPDHQFEYYYDTYFKLPINDTTVFIQAIVRIDEYTDKGEVLILGYTFAYDIYRGWRHYREKAHVEEHKMALQAFEKEVLDKMGVKYRRQWIRRWIGREW